MKKRLVVVLVGLASLVIIGYWGLRQRRGAPPAQAPAEAETAPPEVSAGVAEREITVYFQSAAGPWLVPERRTVHVREPRQVAFAVLQALLEGPRQAGLVRTLPAGTRLLDVVLDDEHGWIYVDFDGSLRARHPGGSEAELMTVYSVVNSLLANLPEYQRVWLLLDHETRQVLKYHIYIGLPLPMNRSWIVHAR